MNRQSFLGTDPSNWSALITRLTLAVVIFPHGAQKLLGIFGGAGFSQTMTYFTTGAQLPSVIAFLVIMVEFFAPVFLLLGLATRYVSFAVLCWIIGTIVVGHLHNGFFMNWQVQADKPEGIEYHLLIIGLTIATLISGGGKASADATLIHKSLNSGKERERVAY